MKTKWLVILSLIFIGIILISWLITQQNNKINTNVNNATLENTPAEDYPPAQSSATNTLAVWPIANKAGITIIREPRKETKTNPIPLAEEKQEININLPSKNQSLNSSNTDKEQSGTTIISKKPSPEKIKEMNAAGIVLY